jgi:hypothetical protein
VTASEEPSLSVALSGPVLVDLHAKLMMPDADVRDLCAALTADDGCSWSVVDPADGSLRSAEPTQNILSQSW